MSERINLPEAWVYTVTSWDCPICGDAHEAPDANLDSVETCDGCGEEVRVQWLN